MYYHWYHQGFTLVPNSLLAAYSQLALSPDTFLLVVALLELDQEELDIMGLVDICVHRYQLSHEAVMQALSRLSDQGYLVIEPQEGGHDRLSLEPLFTRLAELTATAPSPANATANAPVAPEAELVPLVEGEFGRSLSPLEFETLTQWLQTDGYAPELIRLALKEAVLRQALSLKYMDRILINWERQGIKTAAQAQAALDRFNQQQEQAPGAGEAVYDTIDIPLL